VADAAPQRPDSLSGEYLQEALNALHAAGDPGAIYGKGRGRRDLAKTAEAFFFVNGRRNSLRSCVRSILFSALAAEAYVNEFLDSTLKGSPKKDREAIDRLTTVSKYVLGTRLATGETLFKRHDDPIPTLTDLFKLRDRLVHPKPGFGPSGLTKPRGEFEALFEAGQVAHFIVVVAACARILMHRTRSRLAGLPRRFHLDRPRSHPLVRKSSCSPVAQTQGSLGGSVVPADRKGDSQARPADIDLHLGVEDGGKP
jgi:hypothetical protein